MNNTTVPDMYMQNEELEGVYRWLQANYSPGDPGFAKVMAAWWNFVKVLEANGL